MGLQWYLMGMLTVVAWNAVSSIGARYWLDWRAYLGLAASAALVWLTIGWSWASFAEGEAQSGAMGLMIFGLGGLLTLSCTWRYFIAPRPRLLKR
ncbi:hypothetical protein SAMN04488540_11222 [Ferrimonas sediminum]|uniref:Uncharacterized protein n=2 Tax=Ferrimonas sediminum TaxID=718193 RepID=A0A1G8VX47_9GAMM|nr:hypothetical protein SAMN04488540_11222 [Ferrimonas sediminum]